VAEGEDSALDPAEEEEPAAEAARVGAAEPTAAEVCGKRGSRPEESAEAVEAALEAVGALVEAEELAVAEARVPEQDREVEAPAAVVLVAVEARAGERVRASEAVEELERDQAAASLANG
jgi:hypothetical protein